MLYAHYLMMNKLTECHKYYGCPSNEYRGSLSVTNDWVMKDYIHEIFYILDLEPALP